MGRALLLALSSRQFSLHHAADDPHVPDELACDRDLRHVGVLAAFDQVVVAGPVPRVALPCLRLDLSRHGLALLELLRVGLGAAYPTGALGQEQSAERVAGLGDPAVES